MQINFRRLDSEALPPRQAHHGDAGFDLATRIDCTVGVGERVALPTGLAVAIPEGYAGLVVPRSGLARTQGISLVNGPGLIDSGYRGEIEVLIINHGHEPAVFERGQRIAQLVIVPIPNIELNEVDALEDSERGTGGFGSSGG